MNNNSELPHRLQIETLKNNIENGIELIKDDFKFSLSGEMTEFGEKYFILKIVLTNLSEIPCTIEKFNILTMLNEPMVDTDSDKKLILENLTYLRKNEATMFVKKYTINRLLDKIDNLYLTIKLAGFSGVLQKDALISPDN